MTTLHIFGGGTRLVASAAKIARESGWQCVVRTSPRLWDEKDETATLTREAGASIVVGVTLDEVLAGGVAIETADIALSFGAPWIFPRQLIDRFGGKAYNYHPRRLPENRGGGGSSWPILMREATGLAVFHLLTAGIDDGPIVASQGFRFSERARTPLDYDGETEAIASRLMIEWLPALLAAGGHTAVAVSQPNHLSTYWPRLHTPTHAWIDWEWDADDIVSFIAAFDTPYPGARTFLRGEMVTIRRAVVAERRRFHPFQKGLLYRVDDNGFYAAALGGGVLLSIESATTSPRVGDRLFTPRWKLELALATRITYLPNGTTKSAIAGPLEPSQNVK